MILRSTTTKRPANRRRPGNRKRKSKRTAQGQYLLEVKARSRTVRTQRRRWLVAVGCRLVLLASTAGLLYYGGYLVLDRLFFANQEYTLREIHVEGCRTLTRENVLGIARIEPGDNIFRIGLTTVRERLESDPQIQSAEVLRELPSTIRLRVVERDPIAWVVPFALGAEEDPYAPGVSFLVDSYGVLMKTNRLHPEFMHLPLITGLEPNALTGVQSAESIELRAAIDLILRNTARLSDPPFEIRQVDVSKGFCMVVTDARHGRYIFGFSEIDAQLDKLDLLLAHSRAIGREIESANLLARRNLPVKFLPVVNGGGEEVVSGQSAPQVRRAQPVR